MQCWGQNSTEIFCARQFGGDSLRGFGYIPRLTLVSTVLLLLEFHLRLLNSGLGLRDSLSSMEKINKRVTSHRVVNKNIQSLKQEPLPLHHFLLLCLFLKAAQTDDR